MPNLNLTSICMDRWVLHQASSITAMQSHSHIRIQLLLSNEIGESYVGLILHRS